jgi:hypothetical protein
MQKNQILDFEMVSKPDSIEKVFCEKFEKLSKNPMDDETSHLLIQLSFVNEKSLFSSIKKEDEDPGVPWLCQLIIKRIAVQFTYTISDDRVILLLAHVTQSPGTAVMYLWYLQYYCKKNNVKDIDLTMFCTYIFPMGFPSTNDLKQLWDSQKVNNKDEGFSDNLLDYHTSGQSIQF